MAKYKLRKGVALGSLAAEHDAILHEVFVDTGYIDRLSDREDSAFLVLGRAGSGKTALLRKMEEIHGRDRLVQIDPEELSMQYLQNSVLREISSWGVNLEIFYKFLWRHVCVLALVRARFRDASSVPTKLTGFAGIKEMIFGEREESKDTREASIAYLEAYSDQFWISTDTKVQKITSEMENELRTDREISAKLGTARSVRV